MDAFTISFLIVINLVTLLLCWSDKRAAVNHTRRIPERLLMILTIAGGSAGMLAGMLIFRHKTKDSRFRITVPVVLVAETVFCILFYTMPHNT